MTRGARVGSAVGAGDGVGVDMDVDAAGLAEIGGDGEVECSVVEDALPLGGAVPSPHAEQATNIRAMAEACFTSVETTLRGECYGGAIPRPRSWASHGSAYPRLRIWT